MRIPARFLTVSAIAVALLTAAFAQEHQQYSAKHIGAQVIAAREQAASADTLIARQKQLTEAEKRHDKPYIASQLADDFLEISPDGRTYDKAGALGNLDFVSIEEYTLSNFKVIALAADLGILTFVADVKGTFKGQPASGKMYVSATWVKQESGWKLRFAQVTPIAQQETK